MTLVRRDSDLDRVWDDFFFGNRVSYTPDYDVTESDNEYTLSFELPGLEEDNINLEVKERLLTLEVKRDKVKEENEIKYLVRNRKHLEFSKSFKLPEDVDSDNVNAEYKNGVLAVNISKKEEVKPKKITIKS